jgi:glycosyltransferase involved in cell wall biosynthesis
MAGAWSRLDLRGFDLVLTSAHSCANAIRVPDAAIHISYCHTPMRYAWEWRQELGRVPVPLRPVWPAAAAWLRRADRGWARNVDMFIANSRFVAGRIRRAYGRTAHVVHPPVDTSYWTPSDEEREDFFLVAGRLVAYKRIDLAIEAARLAGVPLVVGGAGPELPRLREMAMDAAVRFVVGPDRDTLRTLYRRARALIVPGVEDFGMTMVEAQACGSPVIAFGHGGACEAVDDGTSGLLYRDPSPEALAEVLTAFEDGAFDPTRIRAHAERFDVTAFDEGIIVAVGEALVAGRTESGDRAALPSARGSR